MQATLSAQPAELLQGLTEKQRKAIIAEAIRGKTEAARAGLIDFACYIDPQAARWYRAAHLRRIAGLLERVERGEISRLIISVPPRHWKSSLSAKFMAWYLGRHPERAIIAASYALSLSEKFSAEVRDTIANNVRYKRLFDAQIAKGSNRIDDWRLRTGVRSSFRAVGVGGGITGHGGHLVIIDDPIADAQEAQSEAQREKLWDWYRQVLRTRLEPGGAIVLIQTRWHEDDLAGRLIKAEREEGGESWVVVNIPAWGDGGRLKVGSNSVSESQTLPEHAAESALRVEHEGWLWLDRFSAQEYEGIRASVGDYAWRALYQGRPSQVEGNLIKRDWFEFVDRLPEGVKEEARYYDLAITEKATNKSDPDYTAEVGGARANDWLYLVRPRLYRAEVPTIIQNMMVYKVEHPYVRMGTSKTLHEIAVGQMLGVAGFPIESYKERGKLPERLSGFINLAGTGRVKLVGKPSEWESFLGQLCAIPSGAHDDAGAVCAGLTMMFGMNVLEMPKMKPTIAPYKFVEKM